MPETASDPNQEENAAFAVRMENITKRFPGIVANDSVHLAVRKGAFHAVIGENGAGKSTLLNILYGRYRPDTGRIFLKGREATHLLRSPADAIARGVGMVSQHYALIPALTALENVMLGAEPTTWGGVLQARHATERVVELAERLQIASLDLHLRAERLSVAAQQKVEILKALYRGADILLLDEPTATLAPHEADSLFALLHSLVAEGTTIVFVTHKLREVMTHSDAVTTLRAGRNVGDFLTSQTDPQELLLRMIGAKNHAPAASLTGEPLAEFEEGEEDVSASPLGSPILQVEAVSARSAKRALVLHEANLEVYPGEIVGVAGVDGSGQRPLAEAIVGLQRLEAGKIFLRGTDVTRETVAQRQKRGIAYIPEDRHRSALALDFTVAENYALGHQRDLEWGGGWRIHPETMLSRASEMMRRYDVRSGEQGASLPARSLSGGNQQKVVIARAIESQPSLLVACQPTRGLDVEAARAVYRLLRGVRAQGASVLLFSLDLEEIFEIADRIAVMFNGRVATVLPRHEATPEVVGAWMTGAAQSASTPKGTR